MLGHYAYTLGDDGHVTHHTTIICENDDEAKVQPKRWSMAISLSYGVKIEE
jgi:hypothetical protein